MSLHVMSLGVMYLDVMSGHRFYPSSKKILQESCKILTKNTNLARFCQKIHFLQEPDRKNISERNTSNQKKIDPMVNILADHKILNVFELFMVEELRKLFKQIRKESSLELSLTFTTGKSINTRRTVKGLLDVPYNRAIVKRKKLSNTMIRAYNWLLDFDLIPENLGDLTKNQNK